MNLPNKLTLTRVVLIPVFVVLLLLYARYPYMNYAAVMVFIAASLTDLFDGKIARKYDLVTNFGKFMDPLADKLLVISALICLLKLDMIPVWAVLLITAREFIISGFRLVAAEKGLVLAASNMAKIKTTVQMIMTISLMLDFPWMFFKILNWILIILAVILTIASLIEYLVKNSSVLSGSM